ncbi:MAG: bifunctional phosphoribosyl-AMP cyclohydrolase/phosphoribosyl-ATP diphosphatase HisIE [Actinomycetia bacterium]|nr:bifunctional phosphoribosyl-AMP cyclohydrolase/phosphoribosyl-ATP diphosphatase HisIE [Actinomycetes bacterium]
MDVSDIKYNEKGLVPAIIQDFNTQQVLMLAYMNEESLKRTLETGVTWFFSRSRQQLWNKGETSGNKQFVKEIKYDCDKDTLLIHVDQIGVACHTGNKTCFFETLGEKAEKKSFYSTIDIGQTTILEELYSIILARRDASPEGSYTADLFKEGKEKIYDKVLKGTNEVVDAIKKDDKEKIVSEFSDLFYHLLVLMASVDISLSNIESELEKRKNK